MSAPLLTIDLCSGQGSIFQGKLGDGNGRLKVFAHLNDWWEEFRLYHRKNGLIVKENDDLMSATRYAMMMRRAAVVRRKKQAPVPDSDLGWMS